MFANAPYILLNNIYLTEAGLTQEKLAELMGTKKSNISRLESFKSNILPKVETLMKYARATGHELRVFGFYSKIKSSLSSFSLSLLLILTP